MRRINPFLYSPNPYSKNPFTMLGVQPDATQAVIEQFASARERMVVSGHQPDGEFELQPGECIHAAQCLQEAILRLAFDLMTHAQDCDFEE